MKENITLQGERKQEVALSLEQEIELIKNASREDILSYVMATKTPAECELDELEQIELIKNASREDIGAYFESGS